MFESRLDLYKSHLNSGHPHPFIQTSTSFPASSDTRLTRSELSGPAETELISPPSPRVELTGAHLQPSPRQPYLPSLHSPATRIHKTTWYGSWTWCHFKVTTGIPVRTELLPWSPLPALDLEGSRGDFGSICTTSAETVSKDAARQMRGPGRMVQPEQWEGD